VFLTGNTKVPKGYNIETLSRPKTMRNILILTLMLISIDLPAQINFPALSPEGYIRQKVGITEISIAYERPALDPVSESDIFPYEKENEELKNRHEKLVVYKRYENTGHNIHYEKPGLFIEDLGNFLNIVKSHWKNHERD
jgi:hypothetical protein